MWETLDSYTRRSADPSSERPINVRNEWGGFSRKLGMPVFTGWQDHISKIDGQMRCQISDLNWDNKAGVNNQEYWINFAKQNGGEAAFFVIKAVDPDKSPRTVEWLDSTRVLIGKIQQEGTSTYIVAQRIANL